VVGRRAFLNILGNEKIRLHLTSGSWVWALEVDALEQGYHATALNGIRYTGSRPASGIGTAFHYSDLGTVFSVATGTFICIGTGILPVALFLAILEIRDGKPGSS
jgi:hypothetical protein